MNGTPKGYRMFYKIDGGYIVKEWRGIWVTISRELSYREARALCKEA